ncbi:hypothetical protein [Bernardetia sp.]|uniref:hypothetical protein n=1 Tax=Bernardetia sp. TaxID=1937974 RepID=UPI0025C50B20|nr:hypothetical protein [Bernardetia sp.]
MKNEDKVLSDEYLVYFTKLTPEQIVAHLKNGVAEESQKQNFVEALKSGLHFEGTISHNSFHLKTRGKYEHILKGFFVREAEYTKVEVTFEYDEFISKKWRKILLIVLGGLILGLGAIMYLEARDDLWIALLLVGILFLSMLSPKNNQTLLVSSYKKKLKKLLNAYQVIEK